MSRRWEESVLQRAVMDMLRLAHRPGVIFFHTPNGGWRSPIEAARFQGFGVLPGVPDILLCLPPDGRMAGLELKSRTGRLSAAQIAFGEALRAAGGLWASANSLDMAIEILILWDAIKVPS
jgi:hypothetical protein